MSSGAIIILAAGASSRMGRPKQLLTYGDTTLLGHVTRTALSAGCGPVFVVLGANAARIRPSITATDVAVVSAPDWELGMGASIRSGLAAVEAALPDAQSVLVLLADQPLINAEHIRTFFRQAAAHPEAIVAGAYSATLGVPVLFPAACFPQLRTIDPASGAKPLLARFGSKVVPVEIAHNPDIDTPLDYRWAIESL